MMVSSMRQWVVCAFLLGVVVPTAACELGGLGADSSRDGAVAMGTGGAGALPGVVLGEVTAQPHFLPQAEFSGPCTLAAGAINVNLGNRPEDFVRAAHCQITGAEPPAELVTRWADQLRTLEYVRRVDVVRTLCRDAGRTCRLSYPDPWQAAIPLEPVCQRKTTRDLGAVLMFFSDCPTGVNCGMDWANTHAHGMSSPHPLLAFGSETANYYNPKNAGYWYRQLLDARWAGLQFFLLNTYGPDLRQLAILQQALAQAGPGGVKIALFDDTWSWGQPSSPAPFRTRPDLNDTEGAAQAIYQAKWKPFYTQLDRQYWYQFRDRPLIYFYNSGTLRPLGVSAAVLARMKELFAADFGTTPFVVVDTAYFQDGNMANVADSQFTWETLRSGNKSRSTLHGVTLDHFMVKWDTIGRDRPNGIAAAGDRIIKGTGLLQTRLDSTQDAQVVVIATWNDLGEGTGIERNYDYYFTGAWQPPTAFMSLTRAAQCSD